MKNNATPIHLNRFAELAKLGEVLFHTGDLANLWGITSKNTLYTTIKRYVKQRLLFRVHKGFYSLKPVHELDPFLVGIKALHGYAYVSTETILREQGIIQQEISAITLVSEKSLRFSIAGAAYYSRKLPDRFLYQQQKIAAYENGVRKAGTERAVADLLYFNPHAYFDAERLIDWKRVRALQKEIGYPLTPQRYG